MSLVINIVFLLVSLIAWLWLTVRVWRSSAPGAVFTFFFGLPAFYFLFKYWSDEERNIRAPFFTYLVICVAYVLVLLTVPTYKFIDYEREVAKNDIRKVQSNPEMDRWCRERLGATYDDILGTCIEGDPNQLAADDSHALDVMDQLESHFSINGLESRLAEVDDSTPGGRNLAELPALNRVMQFEIKSQSVMH